MKKEFKNFDKEINTRLNDVLKKDKQINPDYINEVIKSDLFYMFNNYFEVNFNDINVKIDVDENKKYDIKIVLLAERIKLMHTIPNT